MYKTSFFVDRHLIFKKICTILSNQIAFIWRRCSALRNYVNGGNSLYAFCEYHQNIIKQIKSIINWTHAELSIHCPLSEIWKKLFSKFYFKFKFPSNVRTNIRNCEGRFVWKNWICFRKIGLHFFVSFQISKEPFLYHGFV